MSSPNPVMKKPRDLDASIATLRSWQGGKANMAAVAAALDGLEPDELEVVSLATRMPLSRLATLRKASAAQMSLLTK